MSNKEPKTNAQRIETSASAVEEAAEVMQEAANRVESNVTEGIQPDINELRIYMSELNDAANIRQKRLLWAVWMLIALNILILVLIIMRGA